MTEYQKVSRVSELENQRDGFLTEAGLAELAKLDRLREVLVRTGGGRFLCPAQDAQHFIKAVELSEMDYVRDVSFSRRRGHHGYAPVSLT